jgi:hypothetical protein
LVKSDLKTEASVSPLIAALGFPAVGVASRLLDARGAKRDVLRPPMLADFGDVTVKGMTEGGMLGLSVGRISRLRFRRGSPAEVRPSEAGRWRGAGRWKNVWKISGPSRNAWNEALLQRQARRCLAGRYFGGPGKTFEG